jgi:hypothetical protein
MPRCLKLELKNCARMNGCFGDYGIGSIDVSCETWDGVNRVGNWNVEMIRLFCRGFARNLRCIELREARRGTG